MVHHNGIPSFGLGTYGRTGAAGTALITQAFEIGYRHMDTAQSYDTESCVGAALRASGVPRQDVFITTKVSTTNLARPRFLPSFAQSLDNLGVERIDLTLVHWPSPNDAVPFEHYVEDIGKAQELGYTRLIGVSNFTIDHLKRAEAILGPGRIATNQVEVHPYLQNRTLRAYCAERGISVTAYLPLARGTVAKDPTLMAIAERHGATAAQVSLAFLLAEGLIVIPATSRREALVENWGARALSLSEADLAAIHSLERGRRMVDPAGGPAWDH